MTLKYVWGEISSRLYFERLIGVRDPVAYFDNRDNSVSIKKQLEEVIKEITTPEEISWKY